MSAVVALYRESKFGDCLVNSLDEMVHAGKIPPPLALRVLEEFDKAVLEALDKKVPSKLTFKGRLKTYRYCDNVWTLMLSDVNFRVQFSQGASASSEVRSDKIKVVCIDEKLLTPEDAGDGAAEAGAP